MAQMSGIITLVQEGRFRLADDDGRSHLFVLDRASATEPQDLPELVGKNRVAVSYTTPPGLRALVAKRIVVMG